MTGVTIIMGGQDFTHLITNAMRWAGEGWDTQVGDGRFLVNGEMGGHPGTGWAWAYWLGAGYAPVILAKAYLDSRHVRYEVVSDEADGEWMILTDYKAEGLSQ